MKHSSLIERCAASRALMHEVAPMRLEGRVSGISGLVVDIDGLGGHVSVGDRLLLAARDGQRIPAEIVGFRQGLAQAMPFAALDGLGPGSTALYRAVADGAATDGCGFTFGGGGTLAVADAWLGR